LFAAYPTLQVLTGDALFAQRPLAQLIIAAGRDYVLAVKDNQPDLAEAVTGHAVRAHAERDEVDLRGLALAGDVGRHADR
jgi:predicted transposase YbfD/YdcC